MVILKNGNYELGSRNDALKNCALLHQNQVKKMKS